MDRPVYKIDILRSWFYIRDLSFFQYRKRISTAYRDSLVPSNEDICVLSLHISRFITFSFSKRVSHRYAFFFLFLLLSLFFRVCFLVCSFFFFILTKYTLNLLRNHVYIRVRRIDRNNIEITYFIHCIILEID